MDSLPENHTLINSPSNNTEVDSQQQESCKLSKTTSANLVDCEEVYLSDDYDTLENRTAQMVISETKSMLQTEEMTLDKESEDTISIASYDVTSSPKCQRYQLETYSKFISDDLNVDSKATNGIHGEELTQIDAIAENNGYHSLSPQNFQLSSMNISDIVDHSIGSQTDEQASESEPSESRSSVSSADASFSHTDDEDDNVKKVCSQQSSETIYLTCGCVDFSINSHKQEHKSVYSSENEPISINNEEMKRKVSSNAEVSKDSVFNDSSTKKYNQLSQTNKETGVDSKHNTDEEPLKNTEVKITTSKFNDKRFSTTTNSYKEMRSYKSKDIAARSQTHVDIDFIKPDDETAAKIMSRVEFYFTDFNILKNNFLLKHTRKNKEGYVSLKLVTSFRKVKAITRDWKVVAYSLADSKILKLNPEKTKVCRIEPIPKIEDTCFGKSIVVFNLPFQKPSSDQLKELFGKFGDIVYAEVMTSKSKSFNLYHKKCLFFNRDISSFTFGVVEFKNYQDTQSALKDEESYLPKENKMAVVPLVAKYYRFRPKPFRYKSAISYPKNGYGRYYPKSEYPHDIYAVNQPYPTKFSNGYYYEEPISRRNFTYRPNNKYYSRNFETTDFYNKQKPLSSDASTFKPATKYNNGSNKFADNWRQNRHLKANTSMNIDKHLVSSDRKNRS